LLYFVSAQIWCLTGSPYRDKKVVVSLCVFRAPLHVQQAGGIWGGVAAWVA
jgi:hypothetical protein